MSRELYSGPEFAATGQWFIDHDLEVPAENELELTTFVLVHGGFGSPAELAPLIPELEALGHHAIAVDLPSADPAATLDDYAETVVAAIAPIHGPVVVVAHSAGGATISLVPGRTPSTAWCT